MPHVHCIANECTSDSRKLERDTTFYQLPKVKSIRKKWLQLAKRDGLEQTITDKLRGNPHADIRHHVVCSKHFVDGHPSEGNPFPTIFSNNDFKKTPSRKTKNSVKSRSSEQLEHAYGRHPDSNPDSNRIPKKKVRLVKLTSEFDKSDVCYPYVAGEVELSDTCVSTAAADNRLDVPLDDHACVTHVDHAYICADQARKYCQVAELQQEIASLQATCSNLKEDNARLKTENNALRQTVSSRCDSLTVRFPFGKARKKKDKKSGKKMDT